MYAGRCLALAHAHRKAVLASGNASQLSMPGPSTPVAERRPQLRCATSSATQTRHHFPSSSCRSAPTRRASPRAWKSIQPCSESASLSPIYLTASASFRQVIGHGCSRRLLAARRKVLGACDVWFASSDACAQRMRTATAAALGEALGMATTLVKKLHTRHHTGFRLVGQAFMKGRLVVSRAAVARAAVRAPREAVRALARAAARPCARGRRGALWWPRLVLSRSSSGPCSPDHRRA